MREKAPSEICILVVDDLPENIQVVKALLLPQGYEVCTAQCGEEALDFVSKTPPDLILLDLVMPGMDGFEVCRRLKHDPNSWHIPVVIITGLTDREANVRAVQAGADDFLIKPFDRILLQARIATSLKTKMLQDEVFAYQHELEDRVRERTRQLEIAQQVTVFGLSKLAESRDNETGDHIERMRSYAYELAQHLRGQLAFQADIDGDFVRQMYQACPLHDIGKVGIPDRILLKPDKLTELEFEIMKTHATIGGDTLRAAEREAGSISFLAMGRDVAYYHHEKWDGTGYPFGIRGDDIPLPARIVALADVYDALTSSRPYKKPFDHEKSRAIILEGEGRQFDPRVIQAFLACEDRFKEIRQEFKDSGRLSPTQMLISQLETAEQTERSTQHSL